VNCWRTPLPKWPSSRAGSRRRPFSRNVYVKFKGADEEQNQSMAFLKIGAASWRCS
jgi:hypothetical protein